MFIWDSSTSIVGDFKLLLPYMGEICFICTYPRGEKRRDLIYIYVLRNLLLCCQVQVLTEHNYYQMPKINIHKIVQI